MSKNRTNLTISTHVLGFLKQVMYRLGLFVVLLSLGFRLQAQTIVVQDTTATTIFYLENNQLANQKNRIIATISGNIVFEGTSTNKKNILLMARLNTILSKKLDYVFDKNLKKEIFAVEKGHFYLNGNNTDLAYLVAYYEKTNAGWVLKDGQSDAVLLTINGGEPTTGELVAIMYFSMKHFKIDAALSEGIVELENALTDITSTSGSIRKLWGQSYQEFVWDGTTIKPKWGNNDFLNWTFDGYILERTWYGDADAFEWDGSVLKRKWGSSQDEYEVFGNTIRPRYGAYGEEYVLQGGMLKNPWNPGTEDEWEIKGNVPMPIIILVVFGLIAK